MTRPAHLKYNSQKLKVGRTLPLIPLLDKGYKKVNFFFVKLILALYNYSRKD